MKRNFTGAFFLSSIHNLFIASSQRGFLHSSCKQSIMSVNKSPLCYLRMERYLCKHFKQICEIFNDKDKKYREMYGVL